MSVVSFNTLNTCMYISARAIFVPHSCVCVCVYILLCGLTWKLLEILALEPLLYICHRIVKCHGTCTDWPVAQRGEYHKISRSTGTYLSEMAAAFSSPPLSSLLAEKIAICGQLVIFASEV